MAPPRAHGLKDYWRAPISTRTVIPFLPLMRPAGSVCGDGQLRHRPGAGFALRMGVLDFCSRFNCTGGVVSLSHVNVNPSSHDYRSRTSDVDDDGSLAHDPDFRLISVMNDGRPGTATPLCVAYTDVARQVKSNALGP